MRENKRKSPSGDMKTWELNHRIGKSYRKIMASSHKDKEIWFQIAKESPMAIFFGVLRLRHT